MPRDLSVAAAALLIDAQDDVGELLQETGWRRRELKTTMGARLARSSTKEARLAFERLRPARQIVHLSARLIVEM